MHILFVVVNSKDLNFTIFVSVFEYKMPKIKQKKSQAEEVIGKKVGVCLEE